MNWKNSLWIGLIALFFSCNSEEPKNHSAYNTKHLIGIEELMEVADRPDIKIIDFRKPDPYLQGHIPKAFNMWRTDIEDPSFPYGGMMASPEAIEVLLGSMGITSKDTLIVYDDRGGCDAARLWWVLKNYDFHNVKLFNGGLSSWENAGGEITHELPVTKKAVFSLSEVSPLKYHIDRDEIMELMTSDGPILLDTRSADEFSGKRQKKGAAKGGRISGSIRIDWEEAVDFESNGRLKSLQELEKVYSKLGTNKDQLIITYCHSGVRSAHTTFVLTEILGYTNVRNYDGSWIEWSNLKLPIEKDSITTIKE